jgi:ankyrin repeat protein
MSTLSDTYTTEDIKALVDEARATGTSMLSVIPSSKLAKAIQANDMDSVRAILARRPATVHQLFWETGDLPLITAIKANHMEMVVFLMDAGANMDKAIESAFRVGGNKPILCELLARGAKLTSVDAEPALMYAIRRGMYDLLPPLLGAGADVNELGQFREFTPLMLAIYKTETPIDIITQLLDAGADLALEDDAGNSALHLAIVCGRMDVIDLLLSHGLIPAEHELTTALYSGSPAYLRKLLDGGADIYEQHYYRGTYKSFLEHAQDGVFNAEMNQHLLEHHHIVVNL